MSKLLQKSDASLKGFENNLKKLLTSQNEPDIISKLFQTAKQ